ncbi:MAG TPA: hypothetical protein PKD20_05585 [Candidatus Saccharibacteria bacterium]|jgi:hypothetical protein|nr:hypothetical protein [Candidatus Saccharibacteria bacterium]HMT56314.1 hypothetical protein [Candidatus Saccharibacteria bacterium]
MDESNTFQWVDDTERLQSLAHDLHDELIEDFFGAQEVIPDVQVLSSRGKRARVKIDGVLAQDVFKERAEQLEPPVSKNAIGQGAVYFCALMEQWDRDVTLWDELIVLKARIEQTAQQPKYMNKAMELGLYERVNHPERDRLPQFLRAQELVLQDIFSYKHQVGERSDS